jgi:TolB protein
MLLVVACNDSEITSPSSGALQLAPTTSAGVATAGHIAFVRNGDIYVMNADGSGIRRLTTGGAGQPAWSQDGKKLAFVRIQGGNADVYTMNADGTGVVRVTHASAYDGAPAWSPDGSKIAFASSRDGESRIYAMNANGTGVTLLTRHLLNQCTHPCAFVRSPAWSPSGEKIAFVHRFGDFGATRIEVVNSDGSGLTPLAAAGLATGVSWSRTDRIVFDRYTASTKWDIYVVKPDGTGLLALTHDTTTDEKPSWSPDGTRLAFASNRTLPWGIYAMNANGTGIARLSQGSGDQPAWGP